MAPFEPGGTGPDFRLFGSGPVTRYHRRDVLSEDVRMLTGLGYLVHAFDAGAWLTRAAFAAAVGRELGFPDHFGGNLDAFNDCLRDLAAAPPGATGTVLVFTGYDAFAARDPRAAQAVLDIVADNARFAMLFGHRMVCLVQSADPGLHLAPVGATPVRDR